MSNWISKIVAKNDLPCETFTFNNDPKHRIEVTEWRYGCFMKYFFDDKIVREQTYSGMKMDEAKKLAIYDIKMTISGEHSFWQKLKVLTDLEFESMNT